MITSLGERVPESGNWAESADATRFAAVQAWSAVMSPVHILMVTVTDVSLVIHRNGRGGLAEDPPHAAIEPASPRPSALSQRVGAGRGMRGTAGIADRLPGACGEVDAQEGSGGRGGGGGAVVRDHGCHDPCGRGGAQWATDPHQPERSNTLLPACSRKAPPHLLERYCQRSRSFGFKNRLAVSRRP